MTTMARDLNRPLLLHYLTFLEDGDEVTVGRPDIESYGVLPADGAALLRQMADGMSPAAAAQWYATEYGESVDIEEFLEVLDEFGFLVAADEVRTGEKTVRWRRLGIAVFSPVAVVCYAALAVAAVVVMVRDPALAPHYRNLFFTDSLVVLQLGIFFGQMPLILVHEAAHALAGRRLGLNSSLSIGRRFYFLVFETSLDGLVTVPRNRRYLPILAGMLADGLIVAALTILAAVSRHADGGLSALGEVCLAFAFVTVLRVVWQFYLFLRTDLYYLVTTVLGCDDLQTVAGHVLRNRLNRLLGRPHKLVDDADWHRRDREVARWYSWVLLAGYGFLLSTLAVAVVPAMVMMLGIVIDRVQGDPTTLGLLDATVFLVLSVGQFVFAGVLAHRNRRRARLA
jgi:hypothetical protein